MKTDRRGFLALLAVAPVSAKALAESAVDLTIQKPPATMAVTHWGAATITMVTGGVAYGWPPAAKPNVR